MQFQIASCYKHITHYFYTIFLKSNMNYVNLSVSPHPNKKFWVRARHMPPSFFYPCQKFPSTEAINLLAPELFFSVLAHPVYKM